MPLYPLSCILEVDRAALLYMHSARVCASMDACKRRASEWRQISSECGGVWGLKRRCKGSVSNHCATIHSNDCSFTALSTRTFTLPPFSRSILLRPHRLPALFQPFRRLCWPTFLFFFATQALQFLFASPSPATFILFPRAFLDYRRNLRHHPPCSTIFCAYIKVGRELETPWGYQFNHRLSFLQPDRCILIRRCSWNIRALAPLMSLPLPSMPESICQLSKSKPAVLFESLFNDCSRSGYRLPSFLERSGDENDLSSRTRTAPHLSINDLFSCRLSSFRSRGHYAFPSGRAPQLHRRWPLLSFH